ncbi:ATP-dependent RNA helicase DeaD [Bradyrhizobium sp. i1.4.4]
MSFPALTPPLAHALAERNYDSPTPVQLAVLADEAADRDLLVSAQTGSGKTLAYGLAMAKDLFGDAERFEQAGAPLALIVAPTRELALQVQRELAWLYGHAGGRVVSCVGGMDPRREQRELAAGAHIVVGTPGRLCDHLRRGRLDITELKVVVLDEADEMLNLGFREDMEFILKTTPETRRTLLFSATFPRGIVALAKQYQQQAFRIEVAGDEGGHADIEYRAIRVAPGDVEHAVVNVLRFYEAPSALVFCSTRDHVRHLQAALLERGFSVVALSGELTQNERTMALQSLRDGRARVCVATDVAARGIDLPSLDLVIHADLPNDAEVMQHRSGRTGRAGRKGTSVLLVPPVRRRRAEMLLNVSGIDAVWGTAPQAEEIRKLDHDRMKDVLFTEETTTDDLVLAQALLAERSAEDIAAALARLYRARLPSPEDIIDPGERAGRPRDDRGRDNVRAPRDDARTSRGDDRPERPRPKSGKSSSKHGMAAGSVWFRANIGPKKECGSALAPADDLPPWWHRQGRHRRHQDHGHDDRVRNFRAGRGILRCQDQASGQGRQYPPGTDDGCAAAAGAFGRAVKAAAARERRQRSSRTSRRSPARCSWIQATRQGSRRAQAEIRRCSFVRKEKEAQEQAWPCRAGGHAVAVEGCAWKKEGEEKASGLNCA